MKFGHDVCWALLAATTVLAGCNTAEDPLNGAWVIRTEVFGDDPQAAPRYMEGTLLVSDGPNGGKQCALNMTEHSYSLTPGFKLGEYRTASAQQSCQIVRAGDSVSIQSTVTSGNGWTPDNFELSIAGDTMKGRLISGSPANVTMYRKGSNYMLPATPAGFEGRQTFSAQKDAWYPVTTTTSGCQISYKSPLKPLTDPASLRLWIRDSCGGTTNDGIEYDYLEQLVWYVCGDNKLYSEAEIYFRGQERVGSWSPKLYGIQVNGPTIREQGLGGNTLQTNAAYRVLFDKVCA